MSFDLNLYLEKYNNFFFQISYLIWKHRDFYHNNFDQNTFFFFLKRRTAFQVTPEKRIRGQGIKLSSIFPVNEPPKIGYKMYTSER